MKEKMQKSLNYIIAVSLLMAAFFIAVEVVFISYYNIYKIPFGRVDVDNYFRIINDFDANQFFTHMGVYLIILGLNKFTAPAYVFTFLIPATAVLFFFSFFVFMMVFTKDPKFSLVGVVFLMLGTYAAQAFLISAFWAQLYATIFFMWFVIFLEYYFLTKNFKAKILALSCFALIALFHLKIAGMILIYLAIRSFIDKKYINAVIWTVICAVGFLFNSDVLVSTYVVDVSVVYILVEFLFPAFWAFMLLYMWFNRKNLQKYEITWFIFFIAMFVVSSKSALWRPLLTVFPLAVYFVVRLYMLIDGKFKNRIACNVLIIFSILLMLFYTYDVTLFSLNSMLGEMIPGVFPYTYRDMDPNPFLHMFTKDKNVTINRVTGFVSSLTGQKTETDTVIYGPK